MAVRRPPWAHPVLKSRASLVFVFGTNNKYSTFDQAVSFNSSIYLCLGSPIKLESSAGEQDL